LNQLHAGDCVHENDLRLKLISEKLDEDGTLL